MNTTAIYTAIEFWQRLHTPEEMKEHIRINECLVALVANDSEIPTPLKWVHRVTVGRMVQVLRGEATCPWWLGRPRRG